MIAASDGVFEKLSPQDICDMLSEPLSNVSRPQELNSSCQSSLADCIVHAAFERGSMDNLAAIIVPVRSSGSFKTTGRSYSLEGYDYAKLGRQSQSYENSGVCPVIYAMKLTKC